MQDGRCDFPEFDDFFCDTISQDDQDVVSNVSSVELSAPSFDDHKIVGAAAVPAAPLGNELTSSDLHPVFVKGNSTERDIKRQAIERSTDTVVNAVSSSKRARISFCEGLDSDAPSTFRSAVGLDHPDNNLATSSGNLGTCTRDQDNILHPENVDLSEFDHIFCDTDPLNNELTSPDLHPLLAKGNSSKGVSGHKINLHNTEADIDRSSDDTRNAHCVPSVPHQLGDNFGDKRRRLLSTPLLTGYYVSDRPPDGLSHNREC